MGPDSYYRLTPHGQEAFARATRRIDADPPLDWRGAFDLLLLENVLDRGALRAALAEAGYGALGPDLLIGASVPVGRVDSVLRLSAAPADLPTARRLVERAWPLEKIESRYRRFIDTYSGSLAALEQGARFTKLDAPLVRIFLIHD